MSSNGLKFLAQTQRSGGNSEAGAPTVTPGGTAESIREYTKPPGADLFRQGAAGVLELLAPSPKSEGAEILVPGGVREMLTLGNLASDYLGGPTIDAHRNAELQQATREASSDFMGVNEPQNTAEFAARVGLSALVPGGAASRVASGARASRGRRALEYIIPLNQGRNAREYATEAAIGTAAPVAFAETMGATGAVPQDQFDTFLEPNEAQASDASQASTGQQLPGPPQQDDETATQSPLQFLAQTQQQQDQQPQNPVDFLVDSNKEFLQQRSKQEDDYTNEILAGLGIVGSALIGRNLWRRRRLRQQQEAEARRLNISDEQLRPERNLTPGQETNTRMVDSLGGMIAMKRTDDPENAAIFEQDVAVKGVAAARSGRAESAYETGISPLRMIERFGSKREGFKFVEPARRIVEAGRGSTKRAEAAEVIRKLDEIDNRTFQASKLEEGASPPRTQFADQTTQQLRARTDELLGDPEIKRLVDRYHSFTRDFLKFLRSRKEISDTEYTTLLNAHPNYMPRIRQGTPRGNALERALSQGDDTAAVSEFDNMVMNNRVFEDVEPGNEMVFQDPFDALETYVKSKHSAMDINDLLRDFFERSSRYRKTYNRPQGRAGDEYIRVREPYGDGSREAFYHVQDPFERSMFRFHAPMRQSLLNSGRRAFQMMNTGPGNPFFAPVGLMYDTTLIPLGLKRGEGLRSGIMPASIAERIPDLTSLPLAVTDGVWRGMWGQFARHASEIAERSLEQNGILKRVLGEQGMTLAANKMGRAWTNSTLFAAQNAGALSSSRFVGDDVIEYSHNLARTGANPGALREAYHVYKGMLDAVHNGARLQLFARNYRKGMTDQEINRLAARVRNISGDFARAGAGNVGVEGRSLWQQSSGQFITRFNENIPYGNVFIQATANQVRMMRDNPTLWATGLISTTMIPLFTSWFRAQEMGQEYVDYYWNEMSWTDRLMRLHWFQEGKPPEESIKVPLLPEFAPFVGMAMGLMDGIMGWSNGEYKQAQADGSSFNQFMTKMLQADAAGVVQRTLEGTAEGLGRTADPGIPPWVQAGTQVATGQQLRTNLSGALQGETPIESKGMFPSYVDERRLFSDTVHAKEFEALTSTLLGAFGRMSNEFVQAADRAYLGTEGDTSIAIEEGIEAVFDQGGRFLPGSNLYGANAVRSVYGERAEHLTKKTEAFKRTIENFNRSIGASDITRQDRPVQLGLNTVGGVDPRKQQIAAEMKSFHESMAPLRAQIDARWEQINAIDQRTDIPYGRKPELRNAKTQELNDLRETYMEGIVDFEEQVRQQYNVPDFRVDDFRLD